MIVIFELNNCITVQNNQSSLDTKLATNELYNWWDYYSMHQITMKDYDTSDPNYDEDDIPVTVR
jgi:hypothetical protein